MRIFAVNPIQFNNSKRVQKGNWGNFESKTLPSLNCPKDTVSFQGKIPSYYIDGFTTKSNIVEGN